MDRKKLTQAGKKLLKRGFYLIFLLLFVLLAFEIIYRNQWIDTWQPELTYFNTPEELTDSSHKPTLLVLGDSYSAGNYTYAWHLKSLLPEWRVINSAVSGTGIIQTNYLAPGRIQRFQPKIVLYQIYLGNDLLDISYPVNWKTVSLPKNLYWKTAEHLRGLAFLNYRLGQMFRSRAFEKDPNTKAFYDPAETFDPDRYSPREKELIHANPAYLEQCLNLEGSRQKDGQSLISGLEELSRSCDQAGAKLMLLIIPHPAQIPNSSQFNNFRQLGGTLEPAAGYSLPHSKLAQSITDHFAAESGVEVIDASPFLTQKSIEFPVYFANDPHLNPPGQQALAKFLLPYLHP